MKLGWTFWMSGFGSLHPGKLTWNTIMEIGKMILLCKWLIFRFHVNFPGCNYSYILVFGWVGIWKHVSALGSYEIDVSCISNAFCEIWIWNLKISHWKRRNLLEILMLRLHVKFQWRRRSLVLGRVWFGWTFNRQDEHWTFDIGFVPLRIHVWYIYLHLP